MASLLQLRPHVVTVPPPGPSGLVWRPRCGRQVGRCGVQREASLDILGVTGIPTLHVYAHTHTHSLSLSLSLLLARVLPRFLSVCTVADLVRFAPYLEKYYTK